MVICQLQIAYADKKMIMKVKEVFRTLLLIQIQNKIKL